MPCVFWKGTHGIKKDMFVKWTNTENQPVLFLEEDFSTHIERNIDAPAISRQTVSAIVKQSGLFTDMPDIVYNVGSHGSLTPIARAPMNDLPAPTDERPAQMSHGTMSTPAMNPAPASVSDNVYESVWKRSSPEMKKLYETLNFIDDGKTATRLVGIDFQREMNIWLSTRKSDYTRRSYAAWVKFFTDFCAAHGKNPAIFRISDARAFYSYLDNDLRLSKSHIRLIMGACKGLFDSILENNESLQMRNPFDAKDLHPKKERVKTLHVPTQAELDTLIAHADVCNKGKRNPLIYTALIIIRHYGLRVGALPTLDIDGKRARIHSKAHDQTIVMSKEDIALIKAMPRSFSSYSVRYLSVVIDRYLTQCYEKGLVRFQYSAHDIRHA
jgi:hypothetical protein